MPHLSAEEDPIPAPKTVNDALVARIERTLPRVTNRDDISKLEYVAIQVSPVGLAKRGDDDQDVKHLREHANEILRKYPLDERTEA